MLSNRLVSVCAGLTLATSALTAGAGSFFGGPFEVVPGYVTHGVNVYNNEFIADYAEATPAVPFLNPNPPLYEIGVVQDGAFDSEVIDAETDTSRLVATNGRFVELFGLPFEPSLFNLPLDQVGTNFFGFQSLTQRVIPEEFTPGSEPSIYRVERNVAAPTLAQWNKARSVMRYRCRADGTARVEIALRNSFPNTVYTMWDVGARAPLTASEETYAVPLGGLPNILQTDGRGCAHAQLTMPYCPKRECAPGSPSCSAYISLAHHWDNQVYGASPSASFAGVPVGAFTSGHIAFPLAGELLQEPSTRMSGWPPERSLACPD